MSVQWKIIMKTGRTYLVYHEAETADEFIKELKANDFLILPLVYVEMTGGLAPNVVCIRTSEVSSFEWVADVEESEQ